MKDNMGRRLCSLMLAALLTIGNAIPFPSVSAAEVEDDLFTDTTATKSPDVTLAPTETVEPTIKNKATISLKTEHCKITTLSGDVVQNSYEGDIGEVVRFKVLADSKYYIDSVTYGNRMLFPVAENTYEVRIDEGAVFNAKCRAVSVNTVYQPQRSNEQWSKSASYVFGPEIENVPDVAVTMIAPDGAETQVTANAEGKYVAEITENGRYTFRIEAAGETKEVQVVERRIDRTAPEISTPVREDTEWAAEARYSVRVMDSDSGVESAELTYHETGEVKQLSLFSKTQCDFTVMGNGTYTIAMTDKAGNKSEITFEETGSDTEVPIITDVVRLETGWMTEATYEFKASDVGGSNLETVMVTTADGFPEYLDLQTREILAPGEDPEDPDAQKITEEFYTFKTKTAGEICIEATDFAGNKTEYKFEEQYVDGNEPMVTVESRSEDGWMQTITYQFFVLEEGRGLKNVTIELDDGTTIAAQPDPVKDGEEPDPRGASYHFTANENSMYEIVATDLMGNAGKSFIYESEVDQTKPVIKNIQRISEDWVTKAKYSFQVEEKESGIKSVILTNPDGTQETITPYLDEYTAIITQNGISTITVTDNVGNHSEETITETMVDAEGPQITDLTRTVEGWATKASYTVSVADPQVGVKDVYLKYGENSYKLDLLNGTATFSIPKNCDFKVVATDNLDNVAELTATESNIDVTAPEISDFQRSGSGWQKEAEYTFKIIEADSGVKSVTLQHENNKPEVLTAEEDGTYRFVIKVTGTYKIVVTDNVGKTVTKKFSETRLDQEMPVIGTVSRVTQGWAATATWKFTVSDGLSDIQSVTVKIGDNPEQELTAIDNHYEFGVSENTDFVVSVVDQAGNKTTKSGSEQQIDNAEPTIEEINRVDSNWATATEYTIIAKDNQSGIKKVTVKTPLNINQDIGIGADGNYHFTVETNGNYTVKIEDQVGNEVSKGFFEDHIDTKPPVISDIQRVGGEVSSQNAKYSFKVTDTESGIASVTITKNGKSVDVTHTGGDTYEFTAEENGTYVITVKDAAGNTQSVEAGENKIDLEAPQFIRVTPQSQWDAKRSKVSIEVTDNVKISKVVVIDEEGKTFATTKVSEGRYSAELPHKGNYTVRAEDRAGNVAEYQLNIWLIDSDAPSKPTIKSNHPQEWTNDSVELIATSTDADSGIAGYYYSTKTDKFNIDTWTAMGSNGVVTIKDEGSVTYYIVAVDNVGHVSETAEIWVGIDKTAPTHVVVDYSKNTDSGFIREISGKYIYDGKFAFSATASDKDSGIAYYEYRISNDGRNGDWIKVEGADKIQETVTNLPDGKYTVYVRAADTAGNISKEVTMYQNNRPVQIVVENRPASDADRVDAPDIRMETDGGNPYNGAWTNRNVRIHAKAQSVLSGVEKIEYCIDYADPNLGATKWTKIPMKGNYAELHLDKDTNAVYKFRSVSFAGNYSKEASVEVRIQKSVPQAAVIVSDNPTGNNGWYTKPPQYRITSPNQPVYAAPLTYTVTVSNNGNIVSALQMSDTSAPVFPITTEGIWKVSVLVSDAAGNTQTNPVTKEFNLDLSAPTETNILMQVPGQSTANIDSSNHSAASTHNGTINIANLATQTDATQFIQGNASIHLVADGGISGIESISYQVSKDGNLNLSGKWEECGERIDFAKSGQYSLFFRAKDFAGNVTYFSAQSFIIDNDAPTGDGSDDITIILGNENIGSNGTYNGDIPVKIVVKDNGISSGIAQVAYRVKANGEIIDTVQVYPGEASVDEQLNGRATKITANFKIPAMSANDIVIEVAAMDNAGNRKISATNVGDIRIDTSAPVIRGKYDNNKAAMTVDDVGYFHEARTLTISVEESNFRTDKSYVKVINTRSGVELDYEWKSNEGYHTCEFPISDNGTYEVSAYAVDDAGNETSTISFVDGTVSGTKFVIDGQPPEVSISFDNNNVFGEMYFPADRTMIVKVTDDSFSPAKANIGFDVVLPDGTTKAIRITEWEAEGNVHTGELVCNEDGDYTLVCAIADVLGNTTTEYKIEGEATDHFIIDKTIEPPVVNGIVNEGAYRSDLIPEVIITDSTVDSVTLTLTRTNQDSIKDDVSDLIAGIIPEKILGEDGKTTIGVRYLLDVFEKTPEMDGIYELTITMSDFAGNRLTQNYWFSVNRYGSVFAYDEDTAAMQGAAVQKLTTDLLISEFNASGLIKDSTTVTITKNGEPIPDPVYTIIPPEKPDDVAEQESIEPTAEQVEQESIEPTMEDTEGNPDYEAEEVFTEYIPEREYWEEYQYIISAENFTEDGEYQIIISTEDYAGNLPENTAEGTELTFAIDNTAPTLPSIVGLEKSIYNGNELNVNLYAMDNVRLSEIRVYLNDTPIETWSDLEDYSAERSFVIPAGMNQTVRIIVIDAAGNSLDTGKDEFAPGYKFNDTVTVSSNIFVRFFANKPLFYGTLLLLLAAGVFWIVLLLRERNQEMEELEAEEAELDTEEDSDEYTDEDLEEYSEYTSPENGEISESSTSEPNEGNQYDYMRTEETSELEDEEKENP